MLNRVKTDVQEHTAKILEEIDAHLRDVLSSTPDWARDLKSDLSLDDELIPLLEKLDDLKKSLGNTFSKISQLEDGLLEVTTTALQEKDASTKQLVAEAISKTGSLLKSLHTEVLDKLDSLASEQNVLQTRIVGISADVGGFRTTFEHMERRLDTQEEARKEDVATAEASEESKKQLILGAISKVERSFQEKNADVTNQLNFLKNGQDGLRQGVVEISTDVGKFRARLNEIEGKIESQEEARREAAANAMESQTEAKQLLTESFSQAERSFQVNHSVVVEQLKSLTSEQNAIRKKLVDIATGRADFQDILADVEKCINNQAETLHTLNKKQDMLIAMMAAHSKPWYKRLFASARKTFQAREPANEF